MINNINNHIDAYLDNPNANQKIFFIVGEGAIHDAFIDYLCNETKLVIAKLVFTKLICNSVLTDNYYNYFRSIDDPEPSQLSLRNKNSIVNKAFRICCTNNKLMSVKWLNSLNIVNSKDPEIINNVFVATCKNNATLTANWLYNNFKKVIDLHSSKYINKLYRWCHLSNYHGINNLLKFINPKLNENIILNPNNENYVLENGDIIVWKIAMINNNKKVYIKLFVPKEAKRVTPIDLFMPIYNNKWIYDYQSRVQYATVLDIFDEKNKLYNISEAKSIHTNLIYKKGETIYPDSFNDDYKNISSNGIHVFRNKSDCDNLYNNF